MVLSRLDDYPIHQVPRPIATPASTDRHAYGRYWFGAYDRRGDVIVEAAFGRYPNLGVVDGHVSVVRDGAQHSFHVSGAAPIDPTETRLGPYRLEIVEPMRALRITVDDNETGITADLRWRARVGALQEDHTVMEDGPRIVVDMLRFTQFGTWEGHVTVDGVATELRHDDTVGVRDRSWGIRPVGEKPGGRPMATTPNAWLWAPIHFDDECRIVGWFQRPGGEIWRADGFRIPVTDPVAEVTDHHAPGVYRLHPLGQQLTFRPGTRWVSRAEIDVQAATGERDLLVLEPRAMFAMRGLGYTSPEWSHGVWHGELAVGRDDWTLDDLSPRDPTAQHVHHLVDARLGDRRGVGLFEQIIFGPHTQFGFREMLDGAPS
jgi:hypothetical protein